MRDYRKDVLYPFFILRKYENWKEKHSTVEGWKKRDKVLDTLVRNSIPYENVRCLKCSSEMKVIGHILKNENTQVVFLYDYDGDHKSRRAFYTNGVEYLTKKRQCPDCQNAIRVTTLKKKTSITFIEECSICDYRLEDVVELNKEEPIDEKERQRYCIMSEDEIKHAENLIKSMKDLSDLAIEMDAEGLLEKEDIQY